MIKIWKDFDDGNISMIKDVFADSAEFHMPDGFGYKGSRDSVIARGQEYRNSFSAVSSSVNGIISFVATNRSTSTKENWVAIWGSRTYVDKSGKKDSTWLHEAWRVNDDGKVNCLYQFNAKMSPL